MKMQLLSRAAFAALVTAGSAVAQNDECTGALALPLATATAFSTVGSTTSAPAWPCAGTAGNDIWYSVVSPGAGTLTLNLCGSSYDTAVQAFSGTCGTLVSLGCNDDACGLQSTLNVGVSAGTTFVRVGGYNAASGSGTITATFTPSGGGNDDCSGAVALALNNATAFSNVGSTTSAPAWPCGAGGNDIWFSYTATSGNQITVETCGSGYDSTLEVFSGACASLTSIACNDDFCGLQSSLSFVGTTGTTYRIRIGGFNGAQGAGSVLVTEQQPPNVQRFNGTPPNASGTLTFDNPVVPSGPIAGNSAVFTGFGISSVALVGTWTAAGDAMTVGSNVSGQGLVSQNGALTIAGPNEALDNPSAGAGIDIRLNAPAASFGLLFVDQVGFTYDIELYLGANQIGTGQFVYGAGAFPAAPDYWTCLAGPFDRIVITDTFGGGGWGVDDIAFEGGTPTIGTNYCTANNNSTGNPGQISGAGSATVANNNLTLEASSLPNNSFGFFLTSATQGFVGNPGGSQGNLCLGGQIGRYVGPGQIKNSGATGAFSLLLNLTQTPTPTGFISVLAGQTRNFQAWHRDANPTATSNFTNGLSVLFN